MATIVAASISFVTRELSVGVSFDISFCGTPLFVKIHSINKFVASVEVNYSKQSELSLFDVFQVLNELV